MKKILLPPSVDFMLLGTCNLRCPFCFGPRHEIPPMEAKLIIKIIHILKNCGVKRIVFTGGEPTLMPELPKILNEAKTIGMTTVLSTNGLVLLSSEELLDRLAPLLDWIALTLEGDTPEINARMRVGFSPEDGIKHFQTLFKLVPLIRKKYPSLKIKLGTVVAKPNLESIIKIPKLLKSRQIVPDTWKLYQVSPSEYAKENYKKLRVSDEEYDEVFRQAKKKTKEAGIPNVVKYTNKERPGKYLFINPRGEVLIVGQLDNDYHSIGNILTDFNALINRWNSYVNLHRLNKNFEATYPKT